MPRYCECPFPAPHPTLGKCGRCLCFLEPDELAEDMAAAKNVSLEVAVETLRRSVASREDLAKGDSGAGS